MGPITLFDKSFLQSLSLDESVWFDNFFLSNISPLFFVETLADLKKAIRAGRSPEDEVGIIADKTPEMNAYPNVFHMDLFIGSLQGNEIPMDGRIAVANGIPLQTADKSGFLIKSPPEMEALSRWRERDFLAVERHFAQFWREIIISLKPEAGIEALNTLGVNYQQCRSIETAKQISESFVDGIYTFPEIAKVLIVLFNASPSFLNKSAQRWQQLNPQSLNSFAPYADYLLKIELFYFIALATGLISPVLSRNRIDLTYLFYLPFCMLFVSSDNFHKRCAPLFMRGNQLFVWGEDLKKDLGRLNTYYNELPEEAKKKGIYSIATRPPVEGDFLIAGIWDRFFPDWRKRYPSFMPKENPRLIREIEKFAEAIANKKPSLDQEYLDPDAMIVERKIRKKKGNWWLVPSDLVDKK